MNICPTQELLERYTASSCSPEELQVIEAHLVECESCRRKTESSQPRTGTRGKPEPTGSRTDHTRVFTEQTRVIQDDFPTRELSRPTALPTDTTTFVRSLQSLIEGYEIIDEMPRGGQAVVYKAIHIATKTNVAIKVLLPTLMASARARYYFEREAELIASLDHPNIVSIRDSGIIHQQYFFVMQYIEGQSLEQYVRDKELSFREKILLFNKICAAISYAHQQGVIHRDLKFANILVDERGEPHVLDFGLAKAVGMSEQAKERAVATMTGQLAGTLSTMSPEQAAGRPDLIDVRTDVYSLGVILYRMLTGQYPYEVVGSTLQVLQNIQQADPVRPRQIVRKFDPEVEAILLTALAKDPAARYHSAADLKSDIEHWLDGRPIRVKCISTTYLLRKIIARHRYASAVAALLLLIVVGFAYVSFDLYMTAEKARRESDVYARQLTAQTARNIALTRPLVFNFFLEAWRQDRNPQAALVFTYLSEGSKEQKAARFLFDPRPLAEKEADFRHALAGADSWFAEFIIGENYLKNGNLKEAREAYERSRQSIHNSREQGVPAVPAWQVEEIEARLKELAGKRAGENIKLEAES